MQRWKCFEVAAAFACVVATYPRLGAQGRISAESRSETGLSRLFFQVPQGTIRVNYPDDAAAGDTISGTVYVEPSASNQQQQDQNSTVLSRYVVEMPGQSVPASRNRFLWTVPAGVGTGLVTIALRDLSNHLVTQCRLAVHPSPLPPEAGPIDLPLGAQAGSMVSAWGPFNPNSETTITVGGRSAALIAQSPRKVVFQVPPGVSGQTEIEVRNGGLSARGPFRSLGLSVSATRRSIACGASTIVTVLISGLAGLKEPVSVLIVNHEPHVVNLSGGPVQEITISPADFQSDGTSRLARTLTGEHGGGYNVTILVSLPPGSQLPLTRIAARTISSWSRSAQVEVTPEAQSMIVSGVAEARPQLDALFRAQLAFEADPASLLDGLLRDYCFDLRDLKLRALNVGQHSRAARPGFAVTFTRFVVQAPGSGSSVRLQASDVNRFSFLQYLADFLARHSPSHPFGNLLVTSQPDKQLITIDQNSGLDYFTARVFVVSVGIHLVKVAHCQETVSVSPNQETTVNCPP